MKDSPNRTRVIEQAMLNLRVKAFEASGSNSMEDFECKLTESASSAQSNKTKLLTNGWNRLPRH